MGDWESGGSFKREKVIIEIDHKSGFCFGVVNAISKAEEALKADDLLYSLGHIVHNEQEVKRLQELGLKTINHEEYLKLHDCRVLLRAHGEPPSTYEYASQNNITLIDATCPVVLKLQERVKKSEETVLEQNGQLVILGHPGHAEVTGLVGQANGSVLIVDGPNDFANIDLSRPVTVFSQTTKSLDELEKLKLHLQKHVQQTQVKVHDTICRQVSNRVPHLEKFVVSFDLVIFAGGLKSSNARVLFEVCKKMNSRTYFVSSPEELQVDWFSGIKSVGICGATSTPQWLMEKIADRIEQL